MDNLEWVTHKENMTHAVHTMLLNPQKGTERENSKLTDNNVIKIRLLLAKGVFQRDIAKMFGVHRTLISGIKLGLRWSHIAMIVIVLCSCGPAYHLKRAEQLGAKITVDTVYHDIKVFIPMVKIDTVFRSMPGDTVTVTRDRLQMKYVKIQGETVYLQGKCLPDTIKIKVPYAVTTTIKAGYTGWRLAGMILFGLVVGFLVGWIIKAVME